MSIKKGDFVEIDYIGRLDDGTIFDFTSEQTAKKEGIHNPKTAYKPITICVGEHHVVNGLDDSLIGKKPSAYTISLAPEQAFGKKDPKLIKIVPMNIFIKQRIKPFPGLQLNIDNLRGTVRSVSGGRVIVDFNHPLAGRNITYSVTINKIVTDTAEKVGAALTNIFGTTPQYTLNKQHITIKLDLPKQLQEHFTKHLTTLIPDIKKVEFDTNKQQETATITPK